MTKEPKTRKDIIKNIAIVFLSLMLVLTFFSNTIMNYSLAEVNGKYTEYGSIRTGVRGSGTVEANSVFEQAVKGSFRVNEVYVREGDRVSVGEILMVLESAENFDNTAEIEALEEQIETLQAAYDRALLSGGEKPDYTLDEMEIEEARDELSELRAKRDRYTEDEIDEILAEFEAAEKAVEALQGEIEELEEKIAETSSESEDEEIVSAREALSKAEEALETAQENAARTTYVDVSSLKTQYDSLARSLSKLEAERGEVEEESRELLLYEGEMEAALREYNVGVTEYERTWGYFDIDSTPSDPDPDTASYKKADWRKVKRLYEAYLTAESEYEASLSQIESAKDRLESLDEQIDDTKYDMELLEKEISEAEAGNAEYEKCKTALESAEKKHSEAKKALEKAVEKITKELSTRLKSARSELKTAERRLSLAEEEMQVVDELDSLDVEIKTLERSLARLEHNLEVKKESDEKAGDLDEYDLEQQKKEIDSLKEELRSLKSRPKAEEVELLSKYSGVVTNVSCRVGDTLPDGEQVVSIESEESGYTLSFSVSNQEAAKLKIGDTASVSGGYWGGTINAMLTGMKTEQGGRTKLLTFEMTGDVVSGQNLTLIAGEKSTSYSAVVPKSAIHEDSDGKFIYITKTKSTPLGNRYVATRLPVEVIASDDVNSAIESSEATYLYEFAITSTTKPIADGDYVRLAD